MKIAFAGFGEVNTPKEVIVRKCEAAAKDLEKAGADLVSVYPATAARLNGYGSVALFSGVEPDVKGGLPRCIRVIAYAEGKKEKVVSVYLGDAEKLREETV